MRSGFARVLAQSPDGLLFNDPQAPGTGGGGRVTCDFCGCALAGDGAVLKTSDRAKELARIEERTVRLAEDVAAEKAARETAERELAAARAELARRPAAPPDPPAGRTGLHFD